MKSTMRALLIVLLAGVCMPLWVYGGGQKAAEPTPETGTTEQIEGLGEAPMLAEMVARGELPPVEERLPEDVLVLEPEEEIGQYGGTLRMVANGPGHGNLKMLMYDVPVRWNRDLTGYEPNLFKDWVYSEDGTAVTFFLRRGVKWSDGAPFTTDDIRFWWEDLALNEDFGDVPFPGWGFLRGERMTVDIVDDFTVRFNFAFPNWMLPYTIAQGFWVWEAMMTPRHYLEQFHPDYNSDIEDYTLLGEKRLWHQNPDHPVLFAWRPVEYEAGVRLVVERNPYYWKVDTAGNQLPYIDRIIDEEVTDPEVRLLKLLAGEIDASWRTATSYSLDIPVILEAAPDVGLRYLDGFVAGEGSAPGIMINQDFAEDEYVRDVLRNKHFRRALSHAIDRDHINDVVWLGMGEITGGTTASKQAIHFQSPDGKRVYEEWQNAYTEYDVALSNKLLDDFGLTKRDPATGYRVRQDTGEVLELIITDSAPLTTPGGAFLGLIESYWEEIGLKTTIDVIPNAAAGHNTQEGLFHFFLWWGEPQDGLSELDLFTYPENVFVTGLYWRNWPLQGKWFASGGSDGWEPGPIAQGLYDLYASALSEPDMEKRHTYVHEAIRKYWIDEGPFHIAATRGLPMPVFVKENLRNVPNYGILSPWAPACPGSQDPPQWFFEQD